MNCELPDVSQIPYLGENEFWVWHDKWQNGSHLIGYANLEMLARHYCELNELEANREHVIHTIDSKGKHSICTVTGEISTFYKMLSPFTR